MAIRIRSSDGCAWRSYYQEFRKLQLSVIFTHESSPYSDTWKWLIAVSIFENLPTFSLCYVLLPRRGSCITTFKGRFFYIIWKCHRLACISMKSCIWLLWVMGERLYRTEPLMFGGGSDERGLLLATGRPSLTMRTACDV